MNKSFESKYTVYYEDTDASGFAYHTTYLKFSERARSEILNNFFPEIINSLKENTNKLYTDLEQIKKEVDMARNTFKKYKWPSIDVTRKSVEETAASVIKIYEIYKENA